MSRRKLHGLRAIVTGASGGIGQALAVELARQGTRCLLFARRADELAQVIEQTRAAGTEAIPLVGDVVDRASRAAAIDKARQEWGGLDLLVNNAGISASGDIEGESPEVLRQIFEVNFFAVAQLTREAIPLLAEGKTPMIVNIGSILGHRGIPFTGAYCASKFALTGWTQSLRAELAPRGVEVLLVSPGTTNTPLADHLVDQRVQLPWAGMKGVPAEGVARATVAAMKQGKHEIVPNWRGWWMLVAHRLLPSFVDRAMANLAKKGA